MAKTEAKRTLAELGDNKVQESSAAFRASNRENSYLDAIENRDAIRAQREALKKLENGTLDVPGFIKAQAVKAAMKVSDLVDNGESEKIQFAAAQDILDRAGHGKTSKVQVAGRIDHETSKMELINMILSANRRLKLAREAKRIEAEESNTIDVSVSDRGELVVSGGKETPGAGEREAEIHDQDEDVARTDHNKPPRGV